jgi:hypothetical protein
MARGGQLHEKCHLPGKMRTMGGMIIPPSETQVDRLKRRRTVALSRR